MRYFKFVGDPKNYPVYKEWMDEDDSFTKMFNPFLFKPEKEEIYKGSDVFFWKPLESLAGIDNYDPITLEEFINDHTYWSLEGQGYNADRDWIDVTNKLLDEEAFINQCAIAAMKAFISSPERFPEALDLVNIPALAFNVAEEMNEERRKRLKKSSS